MPKNLKDAIDGIESSEKETAVLQSKIDRLQELMEKQKRVINNQENIIEEQKAKITRMYDIPEDVLELKKLIGTQRALLTEKESECDLAKGEVLAIEKELELTAEALTTESYWSLSGYGFGTDYWWKMDEVRYDYTINEVSQYEEYYFEYEHLSIKSYEIWYWAIRHKYTLKLGEFDVINVLYGGQTMWYSSDFGFYEGESPITKRDSLLLIEKGNNKNEGNVYQDCNQSCVWIMYQVNNSKYKANIDYSPPPKRLHCAALKHPAKDKLLNKPGAQ